MIQTHYIMLSGASGTGKSTFLNNFVEQEPLYKKSYSLGRKYIHNMDEQRATHKRYFKLSISILRASLTLFEKMIDRHRNVVFERTPIDSLLYLDWAYESLPEGEFKLYAKDCMLQELERVQKVFGRAWLRERATVLLFPPNPCLQTNDLIIRGENYVEEQNDFTIELEQLWGKIWEGKQVYKVKIEKPYNSQEWYRFVQKAPAKART